MRPGIAVLLIVLIIIVNAVVRYPMVRDCGWMGALRGAEWFWLAGYCEPRK